MTAPTLSVLEDAREAAAQAAAGANIEVRLLTRVEEFTDVVALLKHIWKSEAAPPVNVETLRAVSKAGSYVGGAFDGDRLVGASFGFFGAPAQHSMHSHIAGVASDMRGRSVGFAVKLHQRAWAIEQGIEEISWTFDPLIRRNAHFNLVKLAASGAEYHRNFYGHMSDAVNGADDTDRMLVRWNVADPRVAAAAHGVHAQAPDVPVTPWLTIGADGSPIRSDTTARFVSVSLPPDIESLRKSDPAAATAWRLALRDTLGATLSGGGRLLGFDHTNSYIIEQGDQS